MKLPAAFFCFLPLLSVVSAVPSATLEKRDRPRLVFAHVIVRSFVLQGGGFPDRLPLKVGILSTYELSDWVNDIQLAKQTGIDAFACKRSYTCRASAS